MRLRRADTIFRAWKNMGLDQGLGQHQNARVLHLGRDLVGMLSLADEDDARIGLRGSYEGELMSIFILKGGVDEDDIIVLFEQHTPGLGPAVCRADLGPAPICTISHK